MGLVVEVIKNIDVSQNIQSADYVAAEIIIRQV